MVRSSVMAAGKEFLAHDVREHKEALVTHSLLLLRLANLLLMVHYEIAPIVEGFFSKALQMGTFLTQCSMYHHIATKLCSRVSLIEQHPQRLQADLCMSHESNMLQPTQELLRTMPVEVQHTFWKAFSLEWLQISRYICALHRAGGSQSEVQKIKRNQTRLIGDANPSAPDWTALQVSKGEKKKVWRLFFSVINVTSYSLCSLKQV